MILPGIAILLLGTYILAGALFEWDWFINFYRIKYMYDLLGKKTAKTVNGIIALICILLGIWLIIF